MLTLLGECHFWTLREELRIKPNDLGAFRYARTREHQQSQELLVAAKRDYTERRNGVAVPKNSRKSVARFKDNLKKLEELLRMHKVTAIKWQDATQLLLLFSNGIIAHICIDVYTGDILRLVYEKYLVGKLAAETITDAFFTRTHIVLAYNTNQLTVVQLQQPNAQPQGPQKIANMDARIFHVLIPGPAERKLPRYLAVNSSYDLFVVWTNSSQNEVYPWRPTIRDQDRANIHVFKLKGMQLESYGYCWSENDPICVDFLRSTESQVLTVEQKVSRKGDISAEICAYELAAGKMQRTSLSSIPMGTQICCFAFSPDQEKLFLGTIDRNICLHDLISQSNKFLGPIDIIPTLCTWHCDSSIILIANDRSQFQCFDLALTPIANQLQSEDVTPTNLLDLSHYFAVQPTLLNISFSRKPDLGSFKHVYAQTDCFLLLLYDNGPLACLRFFAGAGMRGDIHNSGLTADVIVDRYLCLQQLEKAVNLLMALNWETYGAMCLISLHKIANHVFYRGEVRRTRLELLAKALKTFTEALSEETKDEFSDQVFDLKRRFFFYLLRKNLHAEAFEVAQDIEDYDLFMDLFNVTKADVNLIEFSAAAFSQAAAILHEENRNNGNLSLIPDYRSESGCSQSSYADLQSVQQSRSNALKNYVPPLPSFKSKIFNAEMIKINIPKPELRVSIAPPLSYPELQQEMQQLEVSTITTTVTSLTSNISNADNVNNSSNTKILALSTGSALATLSLKSGSNDLDAAQTQYQQKTKALNGNTTASVWQDRPPDQTVGLPTVPANTNTLIPRLSAFTPIKNTISLSALSANPNIPPAAPQLHYVTSSLVPTHNLLSLPRSYQPMQSMQQPKFYQHPLVSGTIPPSGSAFVAAEQIEHQKRLLLKKPTVSILSNSNNTTTQNGSEGNSTLADTGSRPTPNSSVTHKELGKSTAGERNKVKFSDTVQVAVVPEIPRKEKPLPSKRNGYSRPSPRNLTNPRKELADSLPLCHPHDDYLKDFNPISTDAPRPSSKPPMKEPPTPSNKSAPPAPPPTIKVVHFGVV